MTIATLESTPHAELVRNEVEASLLEDLENDRGLLINERTKQGFG